MPSSIWTCRNNCIYTYHKPYDNLKIKKASVMPVYVVAEYKICNISKISYIVKIKYAYFPALNSLRAFPLQKSSVYSQRPVETSNKSKF
jgi:hypothetical protein